MNQVARYRLWDCGRLVGVMIEQGDGSIVAAPCIDVVGQHGELLASWARVFDTQEDARQWLFDFDESFPRLHTEQAHRCIAMAINAKINDVLCYRILCAYRALAAAKIEMALDDPQMPFVEAARQFLFDGALLSGDRAGNMRTAALFAGRCLGVKEAFADGETPRCHIPTPKDQ